MLLFTGELISDSGEIVFEGRLPHQVTFRSARILEVEDGGGRSLRHLGGGVGDGAWSSQGALEGCREEGTRSSVRALDWGNVESAGSSCRALGGSVVDVCGLIE
jgi:hypothetical protein